MPRLTLARAVGRLLLSMPARHPTAGGLSYRARAVQYLMKVQTLFFLVFFLIQTLFQSSKLEVTSFRRDV